MFHASRSKKQAERSEGMIKSLVTAKFPYNFYTLSAWESVDNVKSYLKSEPHLSAIRVTRKIAESANTYRWESNTFPTWSEAKELLGKNPKSYIRN